MNRTNDIRRTARSVALDLLLRIEREGAFADRVYAGPEVRALSAADRAFVRELVLGTVRWKLRLDHAIDACYTKRSRRLSSGLRNVMRIALYQMLFLDSIPDRASVNEAVNEATRRYGPQTAGVVNAVLRRVQREGEPPPPDEPVARISVLTAVPAWLVARWVAEYGIDAAAVMARASGERHRVCIRMSPLRTDAAGLVGRLADEGFDAVAMDGMPGWFVIPEAAGLFDSAAFLDGLFCVQDAAAGMAVELLAPEPGERVADLCAAPGGKAAQCAEMMNDTGEVVALDINSSRLTLVDETATRLGVRSVVCREGDAATFGADAAGSYDRVLVDAPCTGTGVLSKRPDLAGRLTLKDPARLAGLQRTILDNAARLVKPGGVVVYSTCSMEPEENGGVVGAFLDTHPGFTVEHDDRFARFERGAGYAILPGSLDTTGAFAALLRRNR